MTRAGSLSTLGVSRFCEKYPAVLATLQRSLLELVCKYQKQVLGYARPPMHGTPLEAAVAAQAASSPLTTRRMLLAEQHLFESHRRSRVFWPFYEVQHCMHRGLVATTWCPMAVAVCSLEEEVEGRAVDASGNVYMTVDELMKQEAERRAGEAHTCCLSGHDLPASQCTSGQAAAQC